MQAAGMLRGTGTMRRVLVLGTLILALVGENAHALPLQVLPHIPGYLPVYIRHGNQPLDEIYPGLAEAFREKQSLESFAPGTLDHSSNNYGDDFGNRPSYGYIDNGEKDGIIFPAIMRHATGDRPKTADGITLKIALPFEVLEREAIEANGADNHDPEKSDYSEELAKEDNERKPNDLSEESVIKLDHPVEVEEPEVIAAESKKEESSPEIS